MAAVAEPQFATLRPEELSYSAQYASIAIREQVVEIQQGIKVLPNPRAIPDVRPRDQLAPVAASKNEPGETGQQQNYKVAIVGAGCAGLFMGLILDHLKEKFHLNVDVEILESNGPERLGGRLYTHYFDKKKEPDSPAPHDYYDVGAMRFPDSDVMARTFKLFRNVLKMETNPSPKEAKPGDLITYYLGGSNTKELYNDVQVTNPGKSTSTAQTFMVTGLPAENEKQLPSKLIEKQIDIFTDDLKRDPEKGWKRLLEIGDSHSVRQWLLNNLDFDTTEWLETYSYGTSWYDEALTEMVLEEVNFSTPEDRWFCVMGGSQEVAKLMHAKLEAVKANRVAFNKKVTKMERLPNDPNISVRVAGEDKPRVYNAVFNSAPLGNMQRMDLRGLNLNWGTKQAIRSLGYGASCKVGIRFKNLWWRKSEINGVKLDINKGGASKTDLPIRNCVYPSYNIEDDIDKPGVLLCSYTWSMEAQRIGSLMTRKSPEGEDGLKALLIDNLAKLHSSSSDQYEGLKKVIEDVYDTHFAYDWYSDPGTTGTFAYFGPGQFKKMYPYIIRNDGVHIIIGEAASAHHAWVVGALESAVRGIYQFLYHHSKDDKVNEVLQAYNEGKVMEPFGPIPAEFDRTKDVIPLGKGKQHVEGVNATGEWLRQGVIAEEIRLKQGGDMLDPAKVSEKQVGEFLKVSGAA